MYNLQYHHFIIGQRKSPALCKVSSCTSQRLSLNLRSCSLTTIHSQFEPDESWHCHSGIWAWCVFQTNRKHIASVFLWSNHSGKVQNLDYVSQMTWHIYENPFSKTVHRMFEFSRLWTLIWRHVVTEICFRKHIQKRLTIWYNNNTV